MLLGLDPLLSPDLLHALANDPATVGAASTAISCSSRPLFRRSNEHDRTTALMAPSALQPPLAISAR